MRARGHWWAAAVRLLLSLAALAIELTSAAPANAPRRLFVLAFAAYAVAAVLSRSIQRFANAPPGLVLDGAFLLVCASLRGAPSAWLSAAVFAFLLVAALLFHSGTHLLAIAVSASRSWSLCVLKTRGSWLPECLWEPRSVWSPRAKRNVS